MGMCESSRQEAGKAFDNKLQEQKLAFSSGLLFYAWLKLQHNEMRQAFSSVVFK